MLSTKNSFSNIPPQIEKKIGRNLHNLRNHPLEIIKRKIYDYFKEMNFVLESMGITGEEEDSYNFSTYDSFNPVVSTEHNFDLLRIPSDHVSRSKSDTYYVNEKEVLRTHTSAHQNQLLREGKTAFLVTADVYRRDEIDRSHYPVFHQMEGVYIVQEGDAKKDLIRVLSGLVEHLFPGCEYRINNDYFPFTDPSFEFEVKYNGEWLEVLGCGVIHREILDRYGIKKEGWAFGLGLERLAMVLFKIPDIRYFWSKHSRFLEQFKDGAITRFKPFSKLPSVTLDISFWIPEDQIENKEKEDFTWKNENDFMEMVRVVARESVESVILFDKFKHLKKGTFSRAYKITYSPMNPDLKDPAEFKNIALKYQQIVYENLEKFKLVVR